MIHIPDRTLAVFHSLFRAGKHVAKERRETQTPSVGTKAMTRKQKRKPTLLRRIAENPIMNITAGFLLMATALLEVLEPMWGTSSGIGTEHGAAIFGFLQFMKWLPDGFKGLKFVEEGDDDAPAHAAPAV